MNSVNDRHVVMGRRPAICGSLVLLVIGLIAGCDRVRPVTGGTPGVLHIPEQVASDLQLNVFREDGGAWQEIGFGTTRDGGRFELLLPKGAGPLRLEPGKYRFTVETAGSELVLPDECAQIATTPLRVEWGGTEPHLDLTLNLPR